MIGSISSGGAGMADDTMEDALVQMLLEVAGGAVEDERDIVLARAAAAWAARNTGWQMHLHNSFFFEVQTLSFWILANRGEQALEIRTRLAPGHGWLVHARHRIAHVGHGLDVLASEGLLPGRFSTLGRQALEDYAEALDRGAARIFQEANRVDGGQDDAAQAGMRIRCLVMHQVAEQARAFPRTELAVMT
jgi:hypothetical protein